MSMAKNWLIGFLFTRHIQGLISRSHTYNQNEHSKYT